MGAATVAARIPLRRTGRRTSLSECGLAFDEPGGPLVAVCGMTGGAGTTTVATCLARRAAAESRAPVLLTEADSHRAGISALLRCATAHPVAELAQRVSEDRVPAQTFAEVEPGLRLIAAAPRADVPTDGLAMRALLRDAREAHGLVVVDCGTDARSGNPVLDQATHVVWVAPATAVGLAGARTLLQSDALPPIGHSIELVVAVGRDRRPTVSVRAFRRAFADRCERLVLMPRDARLARGECVDDEPIRRALTALAPCLRWTR